MALEMKDFQKLKWYYQVLIVAAVCGGLLGGVWYQFLSPKQDDIATKQKQFEDLEKTIAKSEQQAKQLAQIKKDALALQEQLETLKMVLPQEKETDQLLMTLQEQAMLSGLQVKRINPRATSDHDVYLEWPIELEVVGTYPNVSLFLDSVRRLPRIMNITGVRFQGRASEGENAATGSITATYTATTFMYKDEPIATAPPPAKPVK